jgi:hypothetical protein
MKERIQLIKGSESRQTQEDGIQEWTREETQSAQKDPSITWLPE